MIPGGLEAAIFTGNAVIGAATTLARNKSRAEQERQDRTLRDMEMLIASTTGARKFAAPKPEGERRRVRRVVYQLFGKEFSREQVSHCEGYIPRDGGLHSTRRVVIYIVIFAAFLAPVAAAFFGDGISIAYGYPETVRSLFLADHSQIQWLILGSGERTLFIPPYVSLMVSAISGLLFGNQMTK